MKREKQVISPELRLEMAEQVASGKMNGSSRIFVRKLQ